MAMPNWMPTHSDWLSVMPNSIPTHSDSPTHSDWLSVMTNWIPTHSDWLRPTDSLRVTQTNSDSPMTMPSVIRMPTSTNSD
jgi:hypothetical protein